MIVLKSHLQDHFQDVKMILKNQQIIKKIISQEDEKQFNQKLAKIIYLAKL